jgi:hypothetical protein
MTFAMNNEHPRLWLEGLRKKSARKEQLRAAMQEALGCMTSIAHVEVNAGGTVGHRVVSFDLQKEWQREVSNLHAAIALLDE